MVRPDQHTDRQDPPRIRQTSPYSIPSRSQKQFGAVVRRKRLAAALSQEALSEQAGLHRTYVGLLERGLWTPSILVAKKVAAALGMTTAELIAEVEGE